MKRQITTIPAATMDALRDHSGPVIFVSSRMSSSAPSSSHPPQLKVRLADLQSTSPRGAAELRATGQLRNAGAS
jgi:hypothetical protein